MYKVHSNPYHQDEVVGGLPPNQYFESATGLEDTKQQQRILEEFSVQFKTEIPTLLDTVAPLTKTHGGLAEGAPSPWLSGTAMGGK